MKTIAIDFDGTFADAPHIFTVLAKTAIAFGVNVVTVTSRRKSLENEQAMRAAGISWPIIFAYDKPKKLAAKEAGCDVCVWVDDQPHMIGDGTEDVRTVGVFENELRHALNELKTIGRTGDRTARLIDRLETVLGVSE